MESNVKTTRTELFSVQCHPNVLKAATGEDETDGLLKTYSLAVCQLLSGRFDNAHPDLVLIAASLAKLPIISAQEFIARHADPGPAPDVQSPVPPPAPTPAAK